MSPNPNEIDALRKLGLNQYEARAYHALTSFGQHTAGQLSETAEVPRPRIYDVIDRLQGKGFVAVQKGRPVKYRALPIVEAVKTLKRQKQESLVSELEQIDELGRSLGERMKPVDTASQPSEESVWTLKGRDAIYSKLGAMISNSHEHVVFNSNLEGISRKLKAHKLPINKAKRKGAQIHIISNEKLGKEIEGIAHKCYLKDIPTRMVVADDQALLFLTDRHASPEDETGLWVKSPHLAETLRKIATQK